MRVCVCVCVYMSRPRDLGSLSVCGREVRRYGVVADFVQWNDMVDQPTALVTVLVNTVVMIGSCEMI